ncbi:hypothetical protein CYMTET_42544 [Cymbomonas tetramitiformis]|uniref:Uncharacterized protein n=1 Tax=Cymbomonas tetramitiformis TaxID=36881 RepID=A0AAE0C5M6_9CHLO|nr:hypothetical protein CYMTET_42544 [Cymbomonas tetramitiformis]
MDAVTKELHKKLGEEFGGTKGPHCMNHKCVDALPKCLRKACSEVSTSAGLLRACREPYAACAALASERCKPKCSSLRGSEDQRVCINECVYGVCKGDAAVKKCKHTTQVDRQAICIRSKCSEDLKACLSKRCSLPEKVA